jgi:CRP-like cAMP-binding protein
LKKLKNKKVMEYKEGGAFGELSLLHGDKRQATVVATSNCVTWVLDCFFF